LYKVKIMEFVLRPTLFWDTDVYTLDMSKHRNSIVIRVSTRGTFDEFKQILNYYGFDNCKKVLLNARWLDPKTLSFCSYIFKTQINEFRCYTLAQSNPEHFNY
jgi:hypothetical protein